VSPPPGRRPRPLQIHITNCVCLNGGDAAIVEATMQSLRAAAAPRQLEFVVYDRSPAAAARLFPHWGVRPWPSYVFGRRGRFRRLREPLARLRARGAAALLRTRFASLAALLLAREERRYLEEYGRADLVLSKGGTYLVEHYVLDPHFFDFALARALRRPLVLGPQSLGPFTTPSSQRSVAAALRGAAVFLRDERSRAHLADAGADPNSVEITADSAFALADADRVREAAARELPSAPRVAVSVREWRHFPAGREAGMTRYRAAVAALVSHLVQAHRAQVAFISTCQGVPEYWTDDSAIAREVVAALPTHVAAAVAVDSNWRTPSELREQLAEFDLVVATRLHAGILALGAGVPVFPIAYEFKTIEVYRRLGLSDWVQDIETIDGDGAVHALEDFLGELPQLRGQLFSRVLAEREAAFASAAEMLSFAREGE
jgi:colanic acid/amylovoran biosynthesis protein WcaK/AmsJ